MNRTWHKKTYPYFIIFFLLLFQFPFGGFVHAEEDGVRPHRQRMMEEALETEDTVDPISPDILDISGRLPLPNYPKGSFFPEERIVDGIDLRGTQCLGFARYVYYKLFGYLDFWDNDFLTHDFGSLPAGSSPDELRTFFSSIPPGSHIRAGSRNGGHSMILVHADEHHCVIYDCNYSKRMEVDYRSRTWKDVAEYEFSRGIEYVHYPKQYLNNEPMPHNDDILFITVLQPPYKIKYYTGEPFNPEGMILEAVYQSGYRERITHGYTFDAPVFSTPGEYAVTIYYQSFRTVVYVSVFEDGGETFVPWEPYPRITDNPYKAWTVRFNLPIDFRSVHPQNVFVTDFRGNRLPVRIVPVHATEFRVEAPYGGYEYGYSHILHIRNIMSEGFSSSGEKKLNPNVKFEFIIRY